MYAEIAKLLLDDGKADEAEQFIRRGTKYIINTLAEDMAALIYLDFPIVVAAVQELGAILEDRIEPKDKVFFAMAVNAAREVLSPLRKTSNTRWAITINPSGEWDVTPCNDDGGLKLEELQAKVDGDFEIIGTTIYSDINEGDGVMMIINENGEKGLPVNPMATKIARIFDRNTIRGNAVLMVSYGEELKGFSEAAVKEITSRLASQKVKP